MSESSVAPSPVVPTTNVPRDLLTRLYREIGISAVAAALQVTVDKPGAGAHIGTSYPVLPKASDWAA
ncbi:MAG: hypothetical protein NVSMB26_07380 [Beijerinckiaceae bacterium]